MNRPAERMWGSDVIAAFYGLGAILSFGLGIRTGGVIQGLFLACGVLLITASLGLFYRNNAIRVAVVWVLGFSLVVELVADIFLVAVMVGWIPTEIKHDAIMTFFKKSVSRWLVTAGTMFYLMGPEVRAEYVRNDQDDVPEDDEP